MAFFSKFVTEVLNIIYETKKELGKDIFNENCNSKNLMDHGDNLLNNNEKSFNNILSDNKYYLGGSDVPFENNIKEIDVSKMNTNFADNQSNEGLFSGTASNNEEFNKIKVLPQEEMEKCKAAPAGSELNRKY
jgi:hypothetical protein